MTAPKSKISPRPPRRTPRKAPNQRAKPSSTAASDSLGAIPIDTSPVEKAPPETFINRELSWIQFNARVLQEALDERTPLLERLKFLAIFASNLDEFFMVRVAVIKQQIEAGVTSLTPDGQTPSKQLELIHQTLRSLVEKQHQCFEDILRPALADVGVRLLDYPDLTSQQKQYLRDYFDRRVFPVLTPLAVDPSHPFPYISNLSLSLAVVVRDPASQREHFARVKVPRSLPRFVQIDESLCFVPLEQVIAHNLEPLFKGMQIREYYPFRVTRNADLDIEEEEADDLLQAIEDELRKRRLGGSAVRLELSSYTPEHIRLQLLQGLELEARDVYLIDGLLNLVDLMAFLKLDFPELKDPPWTPAVPPRLRSQVDGDDVDILAEIRKQDLLVQHPYESFNGSVLRFIEAAAADPKVLTIKQTLYRTSGDSPVVEALIDAAENGKQVAVLVELKARFDEENNILWAKRLERAGVHVVYGLVGLKTHCKLAMVVRQEESELHTYVHIGTGNYNPKTARLYTDLGIFSCAPDLGADVTDLFNYLTGYSRQQEFNKLLVAPVTLRSRIIGMIRREIVHQQRANENGGKGGHIVAKMNSLVDPEIISALYEAGRAGVKIDLIVRGICCLRPKVPGLSENVRVISIIGQLLEHSRIFYFGNGGQEELYIGSADWMTRNMDRRVEAVVPVTDPDAIAQLQEILGTMLADNRQAWELQEDGTYIQRHPQAGEPERGSQKVLMERALER